MAWCARCGEPIIKHSNQGRDCPKEKKMPTYKVWVQIERIDEDEDEYQNVGLPDPLYQSASYADATMFVRSLPGWSRYGDTSDYRLGAIHAGDTDKEGEPAELQHIEERRHRENIETVPPCETHTIAASAPTWDTRCTVCGLSRNDIDRRNADADRTARMNAMHIGTYKAGE